MTAAIQVAGLTKRFGKVTALDDLDLVVDAGETVALLGPNGAGKSTLLRVLATTVLPDAGTATVAGHDVVTAPHEARGSLGLVLGDERSWYWRLSGRANLEFFATLQGLTRRRGRDRTDELLARHELTDAADRPVSGYSSGMRARLALARGLVADPPVLLLDEPTSGLDPIGAVEFRRTVTALAGEAGHAVLFATHDLHEAAAIAQRVVILVAGRVAATHAAGSSAADLEALLLEAVGP